MSERGTENPEVGGPKWTPGPWHVQYETNVMNGGGECVANTGGRQANYAPRDSQLYTENRANAHLIAATPDLYAALRRAVFSSVSVMTGKCYACRSSDTNHEPACWVPGAQVALAKARGEKEGES